MVARANIQRWRASESWADIRKCRCRFGDWVFDVHASYRIALEMLDGLDRFEAAPLVARSHDTARAVSRIWRTPFGRAHIDTFHSVEAKTARSSRTRLLAGRNRAGCSDPRLTMRLL